MSLLKAINSPVTAYSVKTLWARSISKIPPNRLYFALQHKNPACLDSNHIGRRQITSMTLESSKIIPDVVDNVKKTNIKMDVKYKYDHVENGVTMKPEHAHSTPAVHLTGTDNSKLYTVVMSDPDPPDPAKPVFREWLHWIVANIPGAADAEAAKGTEITSYMGPAPPIGTHRYAFLLFEQPNQEPLQVEDPSGGQKDGRKNFNTRQFAKKYGLGDPVAATYFLSHK